MTVKIAVQVKNGYHVNSNAPNEDYLIPLRLTWEAPALEDIEIAYPKPQMSSFSFSSKPLSVYTGDFQLVTRFGIPATAKAGLTVISGKLRYQACNDSSCFPPKTVELKLPIEIRAQ